jgi:hypothetical protein
MIIETVNAEVVADNATVEQVQLLAIAELSANELALVGGGAANVCFL